MVKINRAKRRTSYVVVTAFVTCMQGCASLPDIEEANLAYLDGEFSRAEHSYQTLAMMGYPDAQVALGDMYYQGVGVVGDRQKGMQWYLSAAETGDARGMQRYAKALADNSDLKPGDPQKAKRVLLKLWRYEGKESVALDLGRLIVTYPELGTGEEAQHWLQLALSNQREEANYYLGLLYSTGDLIPPDIHKAKSYFVAALDVSPLAAHELLALFAKYPELGDLQALLDSLIARKSFEGGKSAYHLGQIYDRGELIPADPEKAEQFYLKALDAYPKANLALAILYAKNPVIDSDNQVFEWIDRAKSVGYTEQADLLLARIYYEGKIIPGEPEQAEAIYLKLADHSPEACYHLGMLYRLGYLGESDYPRSYKYFLNAARMGYESGDVQIADIFLKGRVIKADVPRAYAHFQMAANAGNLRAQDRVTEMRVMLSADQLTEAKQWLDKEVSIRQRFSGKIAFAQVKEIL